MEEVIDRLVDKMGENHIERLTKGECSIANGYVFNDLLTNFERISDHCSNIAISTIALEKGSIDFHAYEMEVVNDQLFKELFQKYKEEFKI